VVLTIVNPLLPDCAVTVAEVVVRPVGVVQLPLAVVQYRNLIDPSEVVEGIVKSNLCVVDADAAELPSVTLRSVKAAADTDIGAITFARRAITATLYIQVFFTKFLPHITLSVSVITKVPLARL
jgi:hypothetical protein